MSIREGIEAVQPVPDSNAEAHETKGGNQPPHSRRVGPASEQGTKYRRKQCHRPRRPQREEEQGEYSRGCRWSGADQKNAGSGRATDSVDQSDPEGGAGRAADRLGVPMAVEIRVGGLSRVLVQVRMGMRHPVVHVGVNVKVPASPAEEKTHRQENDDGGDRELRRLVNRGREVFPKQHDGKSEEDQSGSMSQPPRRAETSSLAGASRLIAEDQGGYCRDVIGVGGVPETEKKGHKQDGPGPAAQLSDPLVEGVHGRTVRGFRGEKNRGGSKTRP